jgi:guanylate kinase
MLEAKAVFSNWYGTSKQSYLGILERGKIPLLDVDIEGMLDIKNSLKRGEGSLKDAETEVLCILPPSWKVLSERLSKRGT